MNRHGGPAGSRSGCGRYSAVKKAREMDFCLDITVIDPWAFDAYSPCGLPFLVDGTIERTDSLYHRLPLKDMNINKITASAVSIDAAKKIVHYSTGDGAGREQIDFDKLIIATGGKPRLDNGVENAVGFIGRGVYTFHDPFDADDLLKALENGVSRVAVVGGGGVTARIDHLAVAISKGATVDDLYLLELSYAPPRSEGTDIIVKASSYARKKLR